MIYQTYAPRPDLEPFVKCYWTLQVPYDKDAERQRIIPDGCIEMIFVLGDDVKRYTSESEFILQPRAMVLGQTIDPFYVEPTGDVDSFAVRFYPFGFSGFVPVSINELANRETPITQLFDIEAANALEKRIIGATTTHARIAIVEDFLLTRLADAKTIDNMVRKTIDAILLTRGSASIKTLLKDDLSKRRQLERKFLKQVGVSPKQLGKVIRMQTALHMMLNQQSENLTRIAYESEYYDQAHFVKDFKEFTGINPKEFLEDGQMALSSIFYKAAGC